MGEDGYRLDPLRDVRSRQQRVREGELAGAVGDARTTQTVLDGALTRVRAVRAAIEQARELLRQRLATGAATHVIALAEQHLVRLRRDLDGALDAQARASATHAGQLVELDAARGRLALARADKELVERHFAQWRTERRKLAERRED